MVIDRPDYSMAVVSSAPDGEHFSGAASSTASTVTLTNRAHHLIIDNMSWVSMKLSFDNGTSWFSVAPKTSFADAVNLISFQIKAGTEISGESISYQGVSRYI